MENQILFTPKDIKWIKSVTRDKGKAWAYMEYNIGDTFQLNFSKNPKWYPTNYLKAKPKEIIVLFQTLETTKHLKGDGILLIWFHQLMILLTRLTTLVIHMLEW